MKHTTIKNYIGISILLAAFLTINSATAQTPTKTNEAEATSIKKCKPGCIKACCTGKETKKVCDPGCIKACCAKEKDNATKKACPPSCIKSCCAKKGEQDEKKPCSPGCTKSCCANKNDKT